MHADSQSNISAQKSMVVGKNTKASPDAEEGTRTGSKLFTSCLETFVYTRQFFFLCCKFMLHNFLYERNRISSAANKHEQNLLQRSQTVLIDLSALHQAQTERFIQSFYGLGCRLYQAFNLLHIDRSLFKVCMWLKYLVRFYGFAIFLPTFVSPIWGGRQQTMSVLFCTTFRIYGPVMAPAALLRPNLVVQGTSKLRQKNFSSEMFTATVLM